MAGKEPDTGPTATTVAANVKRLRDERHLSYTELSERLQEAANWSVSPVGVRRIEDGKRRVTVDDLFSLAAALDVSPTTLLIPNVADGDEQVAASGVTEKLAAERLWNWVRGDEPIDPAVHTLKYRLAALPEWKKQQMLAHVAFRDVEFGSEGGLGNAAKAQ